MAPAGPPVARVEALAEVEALFAVVGARIAVVESHIAVVEASVAPAMVGCSKCRWSGHGCLECRRAFELSPDEALAWARYVEFQASAIPLHTYLD